MISVQQALAKAIAALSGSSCDQDSLRLDAELLLAEALNKPRTWLYTWPEHRLEYEQSNAFKALVQRRERGEPMAHILGVQEFWGLPLACNTSTLIPRADTESLVEHALQLYLPLNARILDLGTGSGAIALALAKEKPNWQFVATDLSEAALILAQQNEQCVLQSPRVEWRQGGWYQALPEQTACFDLIVSNPPYIDAKSHWLHDGDVRFEPRSALIAEQSGMADIHTIIEGASAQLNAGGYLLLEHGFDQQMLVMEAFAQYEFEQLQPGKDLSGLDRFVCGRKAVNKAGVE